MTTRDADTNAFIRGRLTAITADFSGYAEGDISADKTFLELGFDSLFLTQLATAFQKEFAVKVTFRQLITDHPTLNALSAWLAETVPATDGAAETEKTAPSTQPAPPAEPSAGPVRESAPVERSRASAAPASAATAQGERIPGDLASVFARQLDLMRAQLDMLGSAAPERAAQSSDHQSSAPTQTAPAQTAQAGPEAPAGPEAVKPAPSMPAGFGPPSAGAMNAGAALTEQQKAHVDRLIGRYNARTAASKAHAQSDRRHHADPRTAAGFNPIWKEMVYPLVVAKSRGAYLWDLDDNQYIDILNGFGPNYFGHRAPFITQALKAQLDDGYEIGPQTPRAGDAARLMCEMTGMDRVSWVNTGSEAVQAAIRIARTVTGRDKIVVFKGDYHGNFDEVLVRGVTAPDGTPRTFPMAPGIPFSSVENVLTLDYGEGSALEAIRQHGDEIAAVLVEPIQSRRPEFQPREFLHDLRALTEKAGIVLVFDEVITGFRTCPGGAQEYFGVKADMATYGKIIGGGMPIGAVAGRAELMDTFDGGQWSYGDDSKPSAGVTFFAGTFVRHPLAIAAAHASLAYLIEQGPALQQSVNGRAERMARELNAFFRARDVKFEVAQFASQMFIRNNEESPLATLFFYHLRDRGIHVLEGFPCYMTAAHTDDDVDDIIRAAKDAILEMQADGLLARPAGETGPVPGYERRIVLTAAQREIWITSQLGDAASCAFNESDTITIDGELDGDLFVSAVEAALDAHEAFRLRFEPGGQFQTVADAANVKVEQIDLVENHANMDGGEVARHLRRLALTPFDLENGPVARSVLFALAPRKHVFAIYAHHLVFDGYSADLLLRDIVSRYRARLTGERLQASAPAPFSDFVTKHLQGEPLSDYWRGVFADGAPPALDFPTDRQRPSTRSFRGATARQILSSGLCEDLRKGARSLGVSMSALTMAGFAVLLSRLSGREDFTLGLPIAGQAHYGLEAIGYCVNVLPLRAAASHEKSFADFARQLQNSSFDAFENPGLSIRALRAWLNAEPAPGRIPLVEIVFNYAGYFSGLDAPGLKFSAQENPRYAVCQDLFMNIADAGDKLVIDLDYAEDVFSAAEVERYLNSYIALLADIARHPDHEIGALRMGGERDGNVVNLPQRQLAPAPALAVAIEARPAADRADPEKSAPAAAMTETERAVIDAAVAVFGVDDISLDTDFFSIGGHSIHALRLLSRLRRSCAPTLSIRAIFDAESFQALAGHIDTLADPEQDGEEREEFIF